MTDTDVLARRLAAVERALVEGEREPSDLPDAATVADDIDRLESRFDDLERRVAELEGATQALRGYVGNVRSVEEAVERRADVAVATADRLENRVASIERMVEGYEIEFDDRSAVDLPARAHSTDGGREESDPSTESERRSASSEAEDRNRIEETTDFEERPDSPIDEQARSDSGDTGLLGVLRSKLS